MDKLRVYHSFWTIPMITKRFNWDAGHRAKQTLLMAALGCVSAKGYGCHFAMHTDEIGMKLFDCIPYDEMNLTVESLLPKIFWASPKLMALEKEPLGAVHIDIDAFIQSENCVNIIKACDKDVLVQHREESRLYYRRQLKFVRKNSSLDVLFPGIPYDNYNAYS